MIKRLFAIPAVLATIGLALALTGCPVSADGNHGDVGQPHGGPLLPTPNNHLPLEVTVTGIPPAPVGATVFQARLHLTDVPTQPLPPGTIPPEWVYNEWNLDFLDPTPSLGHTWSSGWVQIDEDDREAIFNTQPMIPRTFTRIELEIMAVVGLTTEERLYRMGTTAINRGTNTLAYGSFARVPDCPSGCTLCTYPGACGNANCNCDPFVPPPTYVSGSRDGTWVNAPTLPGFQLEIGGVNWVVQMGGMDMARGTLSAPVNNVVTLTMTEAAGSTMAAVVIGTAGLFGNTNTLRATLNEASGMVGEHTFTRSAGGGATGWCGCGDWDCEDFGYCDQVCHPWDFCGWLNCTCQSW